VHDQALMRDLMRRIVGLAEDEGATGVTRIAVRLGALSHFTPEHFLQHFEDAARGTVAEGAVVDAALEGDTTGPNAQGVVLESVELELGTEREAGA
jgi:hydrogenase nickel incorporation protein HypA/HybF